LLIYKFLETISPDDINDEYNILLLRTTIMIACMLDVNEYGFFYFPNFSKDISKNENLANDKYKELLNKSKKYTLMNVIIKNKAFL